MDHFEKKRAAEQGFRAYFLIMGVLLGIICLAAMILANWNNLNQKNRELGVSLLAVSTEDYGGVQSGEQVQVIGLAIIKDKLQDAGIQPGDLNSRLASVTAVLLSLVPTATPTYPLNNLTTSTQPPAVKTTPYPTATSEQTQIPSNTPVISQTLPPLSATNTPNPIVYLTATPFPTQPMLPTQKPHPTQKPKKKHPPHPPHP